MLTPIELAEFANSDVKSYFTWTSVPDGEAEARIVSPIEAGWSFWTVERQEDGKEKPKRMVFRQDNKSEGTRLCPPGKALKKSVIFVVHVQGCERLQEMVIDNALLLKEFCSVLIAHKDISKVPLLFKKRGQGKATTYSVSPCKVRGAKGMEVLVSEIPEETLKLMKEYPFNVSNVFDGMPIFLTQ